MSKRGKLLFVSRSPPYGSNRARGLLEMALAASVFEQDIELLLLGDGVFQLLRGQDGDAIGEKTLGKAMEALEIYGIEKPLVDASALERRNLRPEDLVIPVEVLNAERIRNLFGQSEVVLNL